MGFNISAWKVQNKNVFKMHLVSSCLSKVNNRSRDSAKNHDNQLLNLLIYDNQLVTNHVPRL